MDRMRLPAPAPARETARSLELCAQTTVTVTSSSSVRPPPVSLGVSRVYGLSFFYKSALETNLQSVMKDDPNCGGLHRTGLSLRRGNSR